MRPVATPSALGDDGPPRRASDRTVAALMSALGRRRYAIAGFALVCGLLAYLVASSLEPVYEARLTLLLDTAHWGPDSAPAWAGGIDRAYPGLQGAMQTQLLLIQSRALAETVSDRLRLWEDPEFDTRRVKPAAVRNQHPWQSWLRGLLPSAQPAPASTEAQARAASISALRARLKAQAIPNSQIVEIAYRSADPSTAVRVVNSYGDTYVAMVKETAAEAVAEPAASRAGGPAGLRSEGQSLADLDAALHLAGKELQGLSGRLVEARARRDDLQALYDQLEQAGPPSPAQVSAYPALAHSAAIESLLVSELQAERVMEESAKRYGPAHPNMIAAQSNVDTARSKLAAEIANAVAGVKGELDLARTRADKLEAEYETLQASIEDARRQESNLPPPRREEQTDQRPFSRSDAAGLSTGAPSIQARVIDYAQAPAPPAGPGPKRIAAYAVILALLAGVGITSARACGGRRVRDASDVEESLRLPVLAGVPPLSRRLRRKAPPELAFAELPASDFAEAIRTLRTGVLLSGAGEPPGVVLVTSGTQGEGKTAVAVNLALALGQAGRVLLIDGNLRSPTVGGRFGLPADTPGLSDLLAGTAEQGACIHRADGANIDVMPAGRQPTNPADLLSSDRLAQSVLGMREHYDRIVVDSPPIQMVSDALILSRACDAVVVVIRPHRTPLPQAKTAVKRLRQVAAPLIGVVFNGSSDPG
jgi:polysaccharide biosynthesis transport protein